MVTVQMDLFSSATDMLAALERRQISSVELLGLHLERIEKYNPKLNAIVIPNYENARKAAAAADEARSKGETGPLLGLPLTIKDCLEVEGLAGTGGLTEFAGRTAGSNSRLGARVLGAGGVLMARPMCRPARRTGSRPTRSSAGPTTPGTLEVSGRQHGGGSAALAAGLTPLEFGSDVGGSIRIPAAFCGVFGHRPARLLSPEAGTFPARPYPILRR